MKILIIGAGIGGLCLGQGLKEAGIQFTIWEKNQDPDSWLEGYRLHINPIGSRALFQCLPAPLWRAFLAATADKKDGIGFLTEQMELLLKIEDELMTGGATEQAKMHYDISRILLRKILMKGIEGSIVFGKTFSGITEHHAEEISVYSEEGTTFEANLVIGADGANSKVRNHLLPHARRVETKATAIAGRTILTTENRAAIPSLIQERMNVVMPLNKYFFFSSPFDHASKRSTSLQSVINAAKEASIDPSDFTNGQNYILWSFLADKKEFEGVTETDLKEVVLAKIDSWNSSFKNLIRAANAESLIKLPLKTMVPVKPWAPGRITLLGDAIHNMPPVGGMGANMALHDAAVLVKRLIEVIRNKKDLVHAIGEYETVMRDKGYAAVNKALELTERGISDDKTARKMGRLFFKAAQRFDFIKRIFFTDKWWEIR